ncbi:MAG: efflux RND transporter periplasmic adaptor subunit [Bacteroidetes bacterium]|nr:efflux RND transporter periplasmic adaptor subunit [Bacteroidota bacterium]
MKTIISKYKYTVIVVISALFIACEKKAIPTEETTPTQQESDIVELTEEQYKNADIKIDTFEMKSISGTIKANGILDVPPQNLVSISAPIEGFLKTTELLQGMKVTKGQVIAVLQNMEYIQLQQDYKDAQSQLEFLESEYKRQEELGKENINSKKIALQAKTQYQSMLAKWSGLKSKLSLLNINPEQIKTGEFQSTITLTAPINGYVTQVNVNIGMYVTPADIMFKIVDTEHLHAEITVFEKDVMKLKIGQKVRFTLANETKERLATVYLIGREIGEDRTVRVHCHLDKEDKELLPGMYLKAYIETNQQNVTALPERAIINFEDKNYIFVCQPKENKNMYRFKMTTISTGITESGYTEVILPQTLNKDSKIATNGAYHLLSKIKNSEAE